MYLVEVVLLLDLLKFWLVLECVCDFLVYFIYLDGLFGGIYGSCVIWIYYLVGMELLVVWFLLVCVFVEWMCFVIGCKVMVIFVVIDVLNFLLVFNNYCEVFFNVGYLIEIYLLMFVLEGCYVFLDVGFLVDCGIYYYFVILMCKFVIYYWCDVKFDICDVGLILLDDWW